MNLQLNKSQTIIHWFPYIKTINFSKNARILANSFWALTRASLVLNFVSDWIDKMTLDFTSDRVNGINQGIKILRVEL